MRTRWCCSYLSRSPLSISTVSSTEGSSTCTGWKRRSSAASFSMYLRYSFIVVAPITWNSPRARLGFKMFAASTAPSAPPAPTIVCISSMKRIIPFVSRISFTSRRIRSSNSPRYFVPATRFATLSCMTRLPLSTSGMSPENILCARPSATAVLPTPGSPISTGLFFVRRESI